MWAVLQPQRALSWKRPIVSCLRQPGHACGPVMSKVPLRFFCSASSSGANRWPLALGGSLAVSILGLGCVFGNDSVVQHLQRRVRNPDRSDDLAAHDIAQMCLASGLAQLPVDGLKLSLLRAGALRYWEHVLLCQSAKAHSSAAVNAIMEILNSDVSLAFFQDEQQDYRLLLDALSAFLEREGSDEGMSQGGYLSDFLTICTRLVLHPAFLGERSDSEFWKTVIGAGLARMQEQPELAPAWGALAAALSRRTDLTSWMLSGEHILHKLVELADGEPVGSGFSDEVLEALKAQRGYAICALHRLAKKADSESKKTVAVGWGRFLHEYAELEEPYVPTYPPKVVMSEERPVAVMGLCALGGCTWGALRCLQRSVRRAHPIWRTVLITSAASFFFQGVIEAETVAYKMYSKDKFYSTSNYESLSFAAALLSADVLLMSGVLFMLVQPRCAPYTLGGWIFGRLAHISLLET